MLICGFLAITLPLASGIGVAIVIGWLLLISGVWHLLFGFRSGSGFGGFLWQLLLAIVYGAAGLMVLCIRSPVSPGSPSCWQRFS